jgi:hypothetical protein
MTGATGHVLGPRKQCCTSMALLRLRWTRPSGAPRALALTGSCPQVHSSHYSLPAPIPSSLALLFFGHTAIMDHNKPEAVVSAYDSNGEHVDEHGEKSLNEPGIDPSVPTKYRGTDHDKKEMRMLGKKQVLRRNFKFITVGSRISCRWSSDGNVASTQALASHRNFTTPPVFL